MIDFFWVPVIFMAGAVALVGLTALGLYLWRRGR